MGDRFHCGTGGPRFLRDATLHAHTAVASASAPSVAALSAICTRTPWCKTSTGPPVQPSDGRLCTGCTCFPSPRARWRSPQPRTTLHLLLRCGLPEGERRVAFCARPGWGLSRAPPMTGLARQPAASLRRCPARPLGRGPTASPPRGHPQPPPSMRCAHQSLTSPPRLHRVWRGSSR